MLSLLLGGSGMQFGQLKWRDFIALFGGVAAWPIAARAQQIEQVRRVGVLMMSGQDGADQPAVMRIEQRLRDLGWTEGRNIRIDVRWSEGDLEKARAHAKTLAESSDVIVTQGAIATRIAREQTGTVPIVFWLVPDPVGLGLVSNLARPGTNVTGFTNLEWSIASKWLELLREFRPSITRTSLLFNPDVAPYADHFMENLKDAGSRLGVAVSAMHARNVTQIETAMTAFADGNLTRLLVLPDALTVIHLEQIVKLAMHLRLPAIYPYRMFTVAGGLVSYGVNVPEHAGQTAMYIDRILKGEQPGTLPVQAPTKFELVVNIKTAKALNLAVPLIRDPESVRGRT
jgi:putative tryptophan/tyrosine transport system substrate-binding protein